MMLISWLQKPYPFLEQSKDKWTLAVCSGVFVALFLIVFQPFDAIKITQYKLVFLAGFGLCVCIGIIVNYFILPRLFTRLFNAEQWQIQNEIVYILWTLMLITCLNYLYNTYIGANIAKYKSLWEFFGITVAIGIFPVVILTFFIERKLNERNSSDAKRLSKSLTDKNIEESTSKRIRIISDSLKAQPLDLDLNDFLFATSDNNYTTIFYSENNELKRQLLRLSLKNLEDQLSDYASFIRCHRSYIVNKDKITSVTGNARSLVLQVKDYNGTIPVSRSFPKNQLV